MKPKKVESKQWFKSKTKWAGIVAGIGLILPGIVNWLNGGQFPMGQVWAGVVAILGVLGIRDLPVLNQKK